MSGISSYEEELKQKKRDLNRVRNKMSKYRPIPKNGKYLLQSIANELIKLEIEENELKIDISMIKNEINEIKE